MLEKFGFCTGLVLVCLTSSALAAEHTIPIGQDSANGTEMGVKPGDVVCVEAGEREYLTLDDFVGTAASPIVIKNCGGQVKIANTDRGYGININGSSFFHLTGTGDPAIEYGFDVSASRTGPDYSGSGVPVGGLSTDYELDHIEVHHTGFAGFILKTESRCDGSANLGAFVQKNTRVHDTYVHDTGGEGFYVGSTGYGGRDFQCDGQTVKLYPHEHDGVYLNHNRIENTGWDGLQVGVTPKNCEVSNNRIVGVGKTADDPVQTRGIQIGGASACKIFGNYLAEGPTIGIFVLGAADTLVYDNVVVDFGEDGIYGNDQELDAVAGKSYAFLHNTVVGSKGASLRLFGAKLAGSAVVNNLFVGGTDPFGIGGNVDATNQGNLELASTGEAGFVNAGGHDYRLTADSQARDTGAVVSGFTVESDFDGVKRDAKPDIGAFEYTDEPRPDAGVPSGSGGSGPGNPASSSEDDDGGCGCRTSSSARKPWFVVLAIVLAGALTARRRRSY